MTYKTRFCGFLSPIGENEPLRHFLESKNETKEHCNSLESFIIQPIQRILKYPLFLRQMAGLTLENSEEHRHICSEKMYHVKVVNVTLCYQ